ncbi:hypothetical protein TSUD_30060 [Trifolium subterraneum]|uniref:Uncharacterized protein n=1 Tax=Trifolium subterraneum TaxID=3900 RepID=A0A2Z6NFD5_TRISU|nr:hypothetical protein TSUD_30060 [Trifolium subterraneum]
MLGRSCKCPLVEDEANVNKKALEEFERSKKEVEATKNFRWELSKVTKEVEVAKTLREELGELNLAADKSKTQSEASKRKRERETHTKFYTGSPHNLRELYGNLETSKKTSQTLAERDSSLEPFKVVIDVHRDPANLRKALGNALATMAREGYPNLDLAHDVYNVNKLEAPPRRISHP